MFPQYENQDSKNSTFQITFVNSSLLNFKFEENK